MTDRQKARIYIRVSTESQDLERQTVLIDKIRAQGGIITGIYTEKASGTDGARPMLNKMIDDLQQGEVVVCESIDRLSRLPLPEAEKLIARIRAKGAYLSIDGIVDFSEIIKSTEGIARIVLEGTQELLLKIALQIAREDYLLRRERQRQGIALAKEKNKYKGKRPNEELHKNIRALYAKGIRKSEISRMLKCSHGTVYKVLREKAVTPALPS